MAAIFGWFSAANNCASRSKRAHPLSFVNQRRRYELERHRAIGFEVACAVDLAHCSFADFLVDLIVRDGLADQKASLSGW